MSIGQKARLPIIVVLSFCLTACGQSSVNAPKNLEERNGHWDRNSELQHFQYRQDPSKWDLELLKKDLAQNQETGPAKPMAFGAFPVPKYALLGKDIFKGIGASGNFTGIDFKDKKIVYANFFANKNAIDRDYVGEKNNGVFLTIVVLTDFVDTEKSTHASLHISSRNNPDFVGQGVFKTKSDEVDFVAFATATGDAYAIVNMRLFNLKHGRTILIAPLADRTMRSMQLQSPVLSNEEIAEYVGQILKQDDINKFFSNLDEI